MSLGPAASGFVLGLALITPIGAQNAYVLQTSVRAPRLPLAAVVGVVIAIDVLLIAAGAAGAGAALDGRDWLRVLLYLGGIALLTPLAIASLRRAITGEAGLGDALPGALEPEATQERSLWSWLAPALALSLLNPHVYLDTVAILGSAIVSRPADERTAFVAGAMIASAAWFITLALLGSLVLRRFAIAARVLDGLAGVVMLIVSAVFAYEAWQLL